MATASRTAARRSKPQNVRRPLKAVHDDISAIDHAVRLIHHVCCLAGSATLIGEDRSENEGRRLRSAINRRDTPALYDWLIAALSYQGISDRVAYEYMERHGYVTWSDIKRNLDQGVSCPKLESYWHFHGCRYDKISRTCAEPDHIQGCPLPSYDLRNGRLNQTAYSLFLFIRDICDGDLIGWIDARLAHASRAATVIAMQQCLFFCYVQSFRVRCTNPISLSREPTIAPGSRPGYKHSMKTHASAQRRGLFLLVA
jgi:hypothetical protein